MALQLALKSHHPGVSVSDGNAQERALLQNSSAEYGEGLLEMDEGLGLLCVFVSEPTREILRRASDRLINAAARLQNVQQELIPLTRT